MKKLFIFTALVILAVVLASCGKDNYKLLIGTWGVERIDYYELDFQGNPIEASVETYYFTPGDMEDGFDLVFREDKTGEMRDRFHDTLKLDWNEITGVYETIIVCPDTTLVTTFTYSFIDELLKLNMEVEKPFSYLMTVSFIDDNTFIYENEYDVRLVEKARMVRYSTETRGGKSPKMIKPHPKSLFSNY